MNAQEGDGATPSRRDVQRRLSTVSQDAVDVEEEEGAEESEEEFNDYQQAYGSENEGESD